MVRFDVDMHIFEPKLLWPEYWKDRWPEDVTFPVDDYLRRLDASGCDVGLVHPTRALFMDGFSADAYNDYARGFCSQSGGRLIPAVWCNGAQTCPVPDDARVLVARPGAALDLMQQEKPVVVHSVSDLRYSTTFAVDHAVSHPMDAMLFLAELATLDPPKCNIAVMESGAWWIEGWKKRLLREHLLAPWGRLWFGGDGDEPTGPEDQVLLGSDYPHFDSMDLSLVSTRQREQAWEQAEAFMQLRPASHGLSAETGGVPSPQP